jgi:hypothetical protein
MEEMEELTARVRSALSDLNQLNCTLEQNRYRGVLVNSRNASGMKERI